MDNKKKVYVGNLSYTMTSDDLRKAFAEFGEVVDAVVIMDKMSGRSRGFGFVEFATDDAAQKAVDAMNGKDVDGRKLVVNIARPARDR
ncbi:RNA-binding protein [Candidatus Woesebacteria bacterium RIFCSPHIGHO2_01_FULL_44_10]|uniref:RNA-binding protein n=1 Tax=Candidatus Woesebacteria bacterium RIFCSPLOWO2_01_FULL_44_14 TaxID=1802525 RepID=A0A1F8C102_9BACT|nr:MAG: RNA-binding protein [Candidatus Woesebacteria bacterium RIFCSPHIGHO2_01_FULL_44_10]OGM55946.1 MAG: RNA-binding protein [Candidatus Woesebacteria bacterium RIFCSPHIGHO2_12_FULL_44_11]OGM69499.1 MAG: RNA-binding protein [Candidatus Woesebacteria bacterium RIFCSPLOWO2_01_FULL_44_14]